jgi:hypothetical protein
MRMVFSELSLSLTRSTMINKIIGRLQPNSKSLLIGEIFAFSHTLVQIRFLKNPYFGQQNEHGGMVTPSAL